MVTYILMAIITLSYLALILFRRKGRANPQITGPIFLVQGVLWIILAALNWNDVLTVTGSRPSAASAAGTSAQQPS